jgi:hypothetical protein
MTAVIAAMCLVAAFVPSTVAQAGSKSPVDISPISAEFQQVLFQTKYYTEVIVDSSAASAGLKITWSITLELVDKAGAPDPEMTAEGMASGAEVDPGCTNHGVMKQTTDYTKAQLEADHPYSPTQYRVAEAFVWRHPDAEDSDPKGWFHCDHELQGPHGHQGLITEVVSFGKWTCVATFKGTHSSLETPRGSPNRNVKNGTASEPTCSKT